MPLIIRYDVIMPDSNFEVKERIIDGLKQAERT